MAHNSGQNMRNTGEKPDPARRAAAGCGRESGERK